jgi:SAM-dependent methyltransferase
MLDYIKQNRKLKLFFLKGYNWYRQIFFQSPDKWIFIPKELFEYIDAKKKYKKQRAKTEEEIISYPILFQKSPLEFDTHYTYQAAWAIRRIIQLGVTQHFDISSDIRFITQISAFLKVIYFEYNAIHINLSNVFIGQGDILNLPIKSNTIESISCLHVIEHIGLGRYGDPIDFYGSIKALSELDRILAPGGSLFISIPVGIQRTFFNAHRIFNPNFISIYFSNLKLTEFSIVTSKGKFIENVNPENYKNEEYACGLYWLNKE